jgi:hypothetical protein
MYQIRLKAFMTPDDFFNAVRDAIDPKFHCTAHAGFLEHQETHHDGTTSRFRLKASASHVAFSLDKPALNPFMVLAPGMNSRNDLTVCCLASNGTPLVFVIECKNSPSPGDAQHQISCGIAFCKYLFELIRSRHRVQIEPKYFGVAVYRTKSPSKGLTRPGSIKFVRQGNHGGLMRADYSVELVLPLTELLRATEGH